MPNKMTATQLTAFYQEVLPDLNKNQKAVYEVFTENLSMTFTNRELADELCWEINSITGRTNELCGKSNHYPMSVPVLVIVGKRKSIRHKLREYSLSSDPVYSKLDHNEMAINPHWLKGGYKIE